MKHDLAYSDGNDFFEINDTAKISEQMSQDFNLTYWGAIHAKDSLFNGDIGGIIEGSLVSTFGAVSLVWSTVRGAAAFVLNIF